MNLCRETSPRAPATWGTHSLSAERSSRSPNPPHQSSGVYSQISATVAYSIGKTLVWREFEGNNLFCMSEQTKFVSCSDMQNPSMGVWGHPPMPLKQRKGDNNDITFYKFCQASSSSGLNQSLLKEDSLRTVTSKSSD